MLAALLGLACATGRRRPPEQHGGSGGGPFKVLGLYSGTWDAAHIDFEKEASDWLPKQAAANGFTYTASGDWNLLANGGVNAYQVVLFLDDLPQTAAQRTGFGSTCAAAAPGWASTSPRSRRTRRAGPGTTTPSWAASSFKSNTWGRHRRPSGRGPHPPSR
ncbi:hypothetical protein [Streptomyces sp. KL116D]|uniref:hypothetical protein n=1 Tax=Streptomyces sp. KL116D TaxID=3045152 RepID=UPI003556C020